MTADARTAVDDRFGVPGSSALCIMGFVLKDLFKPTVGELGEPRRTNPLRWAAIGFLFAIAVMELRSPTPWSSETFVLNLARLFGGGIGGALLFAVAAGVRNRFTR